MADPDDRSEWWIGVLIVFVSSVILNAALNMMKLSHLRNSRLPEERRKNPLRRPLWLGGMAIFIASNVCDLVGYGYGPQSVLAPLGGVGLVSNVFFAHFLLKEPLTFKDIVAVIVLLAGVSLCVGFGSRDDPKWDLQELLARYKAPAVIGYMTAVSALIVLSFLTIVYLRKKHRGHIAVSYLCCLLAGLLGSLTLLFAKSGSLLLQETFQGNNQFVYGSTYAILLMLCFFAVSGVYWMNVALTTYDVVIVVPLYFAFWSIFGIVGGLVYFDETASMTTVQAAVFPVGVVITLVGAFLVGRVRETISDEERVTLSRQNSVVLDGNSDVLGVPDESTTLLSGPVAHIDYDQEAEKQQQPQQQHQYVCYVEKERGADDDKSKRPVDEEKRCLLEDDV